MRIIVILLIAVLLSPIHVWAQDNPQPDLDRLEIITATNADRLVELQRLGRGTIHTIGWSPDGRIIALGGSLGTWLFNADHLDEEPRLLAETATIDEIAFSPDSRWIATSSSQATTLWDLTSDRQITLPGGATDLAFSSNGRFLGAGYSSGHIRLWNTDALATAVGNLISTFRIDDENVRSLAFSTNGEEIFSLQDGEIRRWRIEDGALLSRIDTVKPDELGDPIPALRLLDPYNPSRAITGGIVPTRGAIEGGRIVSIKLPGGEPGQLTLLSHRSFVFSEELEWLCTQIFCLFAKNFRFLA